MSITLGSITFDELRTAATERLEETGGRDARVITLNGILENYDSLATLEAALDAIALAASPETLVQLSLRANRRFMVRRRAFTRATARDALAAAFTLELEAPDPREEAIAGTSISWTLASTGQQHYLTLDGTIPCRPIIYLTAGAISLIDPSFDIGGIGVVYHGAVLGGRTLVFDGEAGTATLDGLDVTPYCTGAVPQLQPGGNIVRFTDAPTSGHAGEVVATYRARWW